MGRYKKYRSDRALREAVEDYFASISRVREVMEERRTGARDKYGHFANEWVPVRNGKGEVMTEREFVLPPTAGGLCEHLGVSRETWSQYCGDPQFARTTTWAREQMKLYLERQLLTREGKNLQGVIFSLQNNYGMSERKTVELGPQAIQTAAKVGAAERDALLRKIAEELGDEESGAPDQPKMGSVGRGEAAE